MKYSLNNNNFEFKYDFGINNNTILSYLPFALVINGCKALQNN